MAKAVQPLLLPLGKAAVGLLEDVKTSQPRYVVTITLISVH